MSGAELPPLIRSLLRPEAYPHPVDEVRLVQTHISWVLLTGDYAYKVKKPLDLGFLDFSTLEKRLATCREEIRLNRRLAPDLYLGVVPITGTPETAAMGGADTKEPAIEYAVRMREFPQEAQLDRRFDAGRLGRNEIAYIARRIAGLHAELEPVPESSPFGTAKAVLSPVRENFDQIRPRLTGPDDLAALERLREWSHERARELGPLFEERRRAGSVRECHGDLHLSNLVALEGDMVPFDCIEFDPALRWIDVMSDLAFLAMDLEVRGAESLAHELVNTYLETTGDYGGVRVLRFYLVYRTLVRAKVAATMASQETEHTAAAWQRYHDHVDLGIRLIDEAAPGVILLHGVSGSGKTHVTGELIGPLRAIRVRSDVERKRLFGMAAAERSLSPVIGGIYAPEAGERAYARIAACVRDIVAGGYTAIADACFLRSRQRRRLILAAEEMGVPWAVLSLRADPEMLRERVRRRSAEGADASEADMAVLEWQMETQEPLDDHEQARCVDVETTDDVDACSLARQLRDRLAS